MSQHKHDVFPFPWNNVYSSKAIKLTTNGKGIVGYGSNVLSLCSQRLVADELHVYFNSVQVVLILQHWMAEVYLCSSSLQPEFLFSCFQVLILNRFLKKIIVLLT